MKILEQTSLTIQSIPSSKPSPVLALQGMILVKIDKTPNAYCSNHQVPRNLLFNFLSKPLQYPRINIYFYCFTCLLQKMSKVAPINFSCFNNECNSFLQS